MAESWYSLWWSRWSRCRWSRCSWSSWRWRWRWAWRWSCWIGRWVQHRWSWKVGSRVQGTGWHDEEVHRYVFTMKLSCLVAANTKILQIYQFKIGKITSYVEESVLGERKVYLQECDKHPTRQVHSSYLNKRFYWDNSEIKSIFTCRLSRCKRAHVRREGDRNLMESWIRRLALLTWKKKTLLYL